MTTDLGLNAECTMSLGKLSKSKLMSFAQCARRLWLESNQPELAQPTETASHLLRNGNAIGALARSLYGPGHLVSDPNAPNIQKSALLTQDLMLRPGIYLHEATFISRNVVAMVDVVRTTLSGPRFTEVKSSTQVKPHHLADVAIQLHIIRKLGIAPAGFKIAHVDRSFIYKGDGDFRGIFREVDVLEKASQLDVDVKQWIDAARITLSGPEPATSVGNHCHIPHQCPFQSHCSRGLSTTPAVHTNARRAGRSDRLETMLSFPRFHLSLGTLSPAIPFWRNTSPYQMIPVQWSAYIERQSGKIERQEYLGVSLEDPTRECLKALIEAVGSRGPILTTQPGIHALIRTFAAQKPTLGRALTSMIPRLVSVSLLGASNRPISPFFNDALITSEQYFSSIAAIQNR